jgi:hypothetical protein
MADVQAVGDRPRQALAANGIRVGLITGDLPQDTQDVLNAPPPNRVDPTVLVIHDGEGMEIPLGTEASQLELLLNRHGKAVGRTYKDAKGRLRISATQTADDGVTVRIVPELLHGPVRMGWAAAPGGGTFAPHTFISKNGQEEETLSDLAAEITLKPGQVAVIGGQPERTGSLGHYLFSQPEGNGDGVLHKVLFIWASRSSPGSPIADASANPGKLQEVDPPDIPARSDNEAAAALRESVSPKPASQR